MTAIAEAGRALGATVALADANLRSPLPVPFYELRMGDTRRAVIPPAARLIAAPVSPGGWNRFAIEVAGLDDLVADLRQRGARFRNDIVPGVGGKQILLEDPSGNPVELLEPAIAGARMGTGADTVPP